jgi:hypothetical protein
MGKWINFSIVQSLGLSQFSNATALILCSGQPLSIGQAMSGGICHLVSLTIGSVLVSTLVGGSVTVSFGQTSAISAIFSGVANHIAIVSGVTTLMAINTCTAQGVAINSLYYNNPMTITTNVG